MTEVAQHLGPEMVPNPNNIAPAVGAVALLDDMKIPSEHSRSIEDRDTYKGLRELVAIGVAVPLGSGELIHGRYDTAEGADWVVDPYLDNGGNATNNNNVYERPVLYVASNDKAGQFSQARAEEAILQEISRDIANQLFARLPEDKKQTYRNLSRQGSTDEEVAFRHLGFEASRMFHGMDQRAKKQTYASMSQRVGLYRYAIASHDTEAVLIDTTKQLTPEENNENARWHT